MRRGILANRDELKALNARIAVHPYDKCYEALRKRCALILESAPMTEMNWQSAWASGRHGAALAAARGAQGRILDLSIADGIDPNGAYRSRAVEELMNLVRWSTWVDPARAKLPADRCTAEAAVASVIGLDMLWDFLTADQRQEILTALRKRVIEPIGKAVANRDLWWYTAVNHWNAVCNSACGLVGLALGDEDDSAEQVHQLARKGLQHFFNDLGKEGGWDEGIGYWGYAMRYVMLFAHASARLIDDQELLHRRGMDETGLFPIYFSPNGHPASFGDNAMMPLHGSLYLLDAYFQCPELTWWLDTYSFTHDVNTTDWSQAGLAMLFRPESAKAPTEPKLKPMKVFHQIGWGAMADRWPRPKFYAAIKTGDLAASHSQRDMNSLQLQIDGEMLLVDLGNPPEEGSSYFSDARSEFYEIRARAHNTITIAEEDHQPDAQGAIVDSDSTKNTRWFVCDANSACSHDVRFFRHVVMLTDKKNQSLVILDELNLGAPENVNLFWHTGGQIELNEKMMLGKITGQRASLHFALGATASAEISMNMHKLDSRRMDRFIQLSSGMIGPNYLISVFSRKAIHSAVEFSGDADNGMKIHFDKMRLTFGPGRKHLVFTGFEYL